MTAGPVPVPNAPVRIRARGWGFRHGGRLAWALRGVDLDVGPGERVLLAGPSGAGKSTLLSATAGLLDSEQTGGSGAAEGTLELDGRPPAEVRERVGLMFQDPETQLVMARAGDDVAFGLENHAVPTERIWPAVDEAFALAGFPYDRDHLTGRLSGGEKQRLVLAGVVALRPGLLLLDEPTANLDSDGAALVRKSVGRVVAETGATLVIVEHRVDDWLDLVDRAVVLEAGGGVVADGPPGPVFATAGASLAESGVWVPGHPLPTAPRANPLGPATPLIVGDTLTYAYPGAERPAVTDADVDLRAGEALAVRGPNGSGKSTLAMLLAGLLRPTSGTSHATAALTGVLGDVRAADASRPLHRWRAGHLVRAVGTVFQDPEHQFLTGTVRTELALGPRLAGLGERDTRRRVDDLLERLRLDHVATANPFTLSGGEKRRLSVATALATEPRVLVLDEPTFGQDRRTWVELLHLVAGLRDAGHAVCCVSHDADFVRALADRELVAEDGRIRP